MKKYHPSILLGVALVLITVAFPVRAASLGQRVGGFVLLQVESRGEAWYVNPADLMRYYMRDGNAAYDIMRQFGLGITNADLTRLQTWDLAMRDRLLGKIVLQVQSRGEAFYVCPKDASVRYIKDGNAAYQLMRGCSLGITNKDLALIPVGSFAISTPQPLSQEPTPYANPVATNPLPDNSTNSIPPTIPTSPPSNPLADPTTPDPAARGVADCSNKKDFTMALIFVARNGTSTAELDQYKDELEYIRNRFPAAFHSATSEFATLSIPDPVKILYAPTLPLNTELYTPDILKEFYKSAPDHYDFVTIYNNVADTAVNASHSIVKNSIKGIGLTSTFDNSALYGSGGRLMGINSMGNRLDSAAFLSCYKDQKNNLSSFTFNNDCGVGVLLHETAHQWAAYGPESVLAYDPSAVSLPLKDSFSHYYYGLTTPVGTYDPFGLADWRMSPDNSVWINYLLLGSSVMKYHPFTLYFMGLLPSSEYGTPFNVLQNHGSYNDGNVSEESMQSVYKQLSVNDIISSYGPRSCEAYEHVIVAE